MPTISTARYNQMVSQGVDKRFAKLQENDVKTASGKAVKNYSDLKSRQLYDLFNKQEISKNTEAKDVVYDRVLNKIENTNRAMERIFEIITNARKTVIMASHNPDKKPYIELMKQGLADIEGELNTNFNGRYIFSGARSDIKPVAQISLNSNIMWDLEAMQFVPTDNYYHGDNYLEKIEIFPGEIVEFGVLANEPIFQEAIAGLHYIKDGLEEKASDAINQGLELLEKSSEAILNKIVKLGQVGGRIEEHQEIQKNQQESITQSLRAIISADLVELAIERNFESQSIQAQLANAAEIRKSTQAVINLLN